jgi:hypothetical protein
MRMLPFRRALSLSRRLDLDVDRMPICLMCLLDVALALHAGDEPQTRGATVRVSPDLWDEGLEAPLRLALERACEEAIPDARQALEDVDRLGPRTTIARAAVRLLAHQLNVRTYSAWN